MDRKPLKAITLARLLHGTELPEDLNPTACLSRGFPDGSDGKESADSAEDPGLILGSGLIPQSGRFPGEGNSYPLQYPCLENPMGRGAWWATVHFQGLLQALRRPARTQRRRRQSPPKWKHGLTLLQEISGPLRSQGWRRTSWG